MNNVVEVSLNTFVYDKATKRLIGEMSDFGKEFHFSAIGVYNIGLKVVSHVTGNKVAFVVTETDINDDNELLAWKLSSVDDFGRRDGKFHMTLFND